MDHLKQTPEWAETGAAPAEAVMTDGACGGCGGCGDPAGGCGPCACPRAAEPASEQLAAAIEELRELELMPLPTKSEESAEPPEKLLKAIEVHFHAGNRVYYFDPNGLALSKGAHVVVETARCPEYGVCVSEIYEVSRDDVLTPLRKVLRVTTEADEKTFAENTALERRAKTLCQETIDERGLGMQLVSCECAFDGSKLLFYFTADGRVDFRELVKYLASVFRTRIELRQIGVRDRAKLYGGLGACGRPFCCQQFLDGFQPVSIRMAKTQNLSLSPGKISGNCGRLLCCLQYEQEAYEDLIKSVPKPESFVDTPDGRGTVCDVNLLRQSVRVRMEDHPEIFGTYAVSEIAVLRNGKGRRNDPPIPRDVAPISGRPNPVRHVEPDKREEAMTSIFKKLDSYTDRPNGAPRHPAEQGGEEGTQSEPRRRGRRRRSYGPKQSQPEGRKGDGRQSASEPQAVQGEQGGQPSKPHANRRRRNRRPQNPPQES